MSAVARLKAYLQLCRVSNLPTVWTNVLVGCLLSGASVSPPVFLLLSGSLSCFYLGGMVLNDLCDSGYDRRHRPERPIPVGSVTERDACILSSLLFGAGFVSLAFAPNRSGLVGAMLLLAAIVLYDLNHKQNPYGVTMMGVCRFMVYAVSSLAVSGRLTAEVVVAASFQFLYIVFLSSVARRVEGGGEMKFNATATLIAAISLIDGAFLMLLVGSKWFLPGLAGALLTLGAQKYVRGD